MNKFISMQMPLTIMAILENRQMDSGNSRAHLCLVAVANLHRHDDFSATRAVSRIHRERSMLRTRHDDYEQQAGGGSFPLINLRLRVSECAIDER